MECIKPHQINDETQKARISNVECDVLVFIQRYLIESQYYPNDIITYYV